MVCVGVASCLCWCIIQVHHWSTIMYIVGMLLCLHWSTVVSAIASIIALIVSCTVKVADYVLSVMLPLIPKRRFL